VPHDIRDELVDLMKKWSQKTEMAVTRLVRTCGLSVSKYYNWKERYGRAKDSRVLEF